MKTAVLLLLLLLVNGVFTSKRLLNLRQLAANNAIKEADRVEQDDDKSNTADQQQPRIYNGEAATDNEFPFVALVLTTYTYDTHEQPLDQYMCGGSILNETVVLTAAHCVLDEVGRIGYNEPLLPLAFEVYVGKQHLYNEDATEVLHRSKGVIVHPGYDSYMVENDIALIILEEPIEFGENVQPIKLPTDADADSLYAAQAPISVIGWGTTESGYVSNTLQKLDYVVTSAEDCAESYGNEILPGMMCTGAPPMDERSGGGDSGGPLFTNVNGEWTQLALVTWGPYSITDTTYDVNTDVYYYKSWIEYSINAIPDLLDEVLTANSETSSARTVELTNLMYRVITIKPSNPDLYARIDFVSGRMPTKTSVMIYDGDNVRTDNMLATLSGLLTGLHYTATTTRGLALAIRTNDMDISNGFRFTYHQVSTAGTAPDKLDCPKGFWGCRDHRFCLMNEEKCNGSAQCVDASDESIDACADESWCSNNIDWAKNCTYEQFDCQDICVRKGEYVCECQNSSLCQKGGFQVHLKECNECEEDSATDDSTTLPDDVLVDVDTLNEIDCPWYVSWEEGCSYESWLGATICVQSGSYQCSCGSDENCQELVEVHQPKRECNANLCGGVSQCEDTDGDDGGNGNVGWDVSFDDDDAGHDEKYVFAPDYSITINHDGCGWYYYTFDECRYEVQGTRTVCMQRSTLVCRCKKGSYCKDGDFIDNKVECYDWKCSDGETTCHG